jgi:hypothetical protein
MKLNIYETVDSYYYPYVNKQLSFYISKDFRDLIEKQGYRVTTNHDFYSKNDCEKCAIQYIIICLIKGSNNLEIKNI